jgi:hypothetical protein
MVTGLKQMLTIMGIPFNMIKIYSKYRIPEEYTKKFYSIDTISNKWLNFFKTIKNDFT